MPSAESSTRRMLKPSEGGRTADFDIAVGRRIQKRRRELRMSKKRLGELVGVSGMHIAHHESGDRRLGAARLYDLSIVLGVPVTYFFSELDGLSPMESASVEPLQVNSTPDVQSVDAIVRLGKLAASIDDEKTRAVVRELLKTLPLFRVDDL